MKKKCPLCKSSLEKKTGIYGEYIGCSNKDCNYTDGKKWEFRKQVCPNCGDEFVPDKDKSLNRIYCSPKCKEEAKKKERRE